MIGAHASCDKCNKVKQKCLYNKVPANPTIPRGRKHEGADTKSVVTRSKRGASKAIAKEPSTSKLTTANVGDHDEDEETIFDGLKIPGLRDPYFDQNSARRRHLLRSMQVSLMVQRSIIDRSLRACERELAANSNEEDWSRHLPEIDELVRTGEADSITSPSDFGTLSGIWSEPEELTRTTAKTSKGKGKAKEVADEIEDEIEDADGEEDEGKEDGKDSEFHP